MLKNKGALRGTAVHTLVPYDLLASILPIDPVPGS